MQNFLRITVSFLDSVPSFHGRNDDGDPEWPPSPLRLFQALVAAAATRWREDQFREYTQPALQWLESQLPEVVSPAVPAKSFGYRIYVPNNSGDLMTAAWARGDTETTMAKFRVEKEVRPTRLSSDGLNYLYALPPDGCPHLEVLKAAARSITHLGWGIDMVAADADVITEAEAAKLPGERWVKGTTGTVLRVPTTGTLDDLIRKHRDFLNRLSGDGFKPVPPLRYFDIKHYRRANEPESKPYCVFHLLQPDASRSLALHPRRTRDVAAWMRHAVAKVCEKWPWDDFASFVHGHTADGGRVKGVDADKRFQYLPMPTIEHRGDAGEVVRSIRRVMVTAPVGYADRIEFIRKRLLGHELIFNDEVKGMLNLHVGRDWVREQYTEPARHWSSVSPVFLPGYDDHNPAKTQRLLSKAFVDAGLPTELLGHGFEFDWQPFGYRRGVEPVKSFLRPDHITGTAVHVSLKFPHPVRGPLAIGAGRYRGFGLFAAANS